MCVFVVVVTAVDQGVRKRREHTPKSRDATLSSPCASETLHLSIAQYGIWNAAQLLNPSHILNVRLAWVECWRGCASCRLLHDDSSSRIAAAEREAFAMLYISDGMILGRAKECRLEHRIDVPQWIGWFEESPMHEDKIHFLDVCVCARFRFFTCRRSTRET